MAKETLTGPGGLKIVLDSAQIFPADPGLGCPALVELGKHSASFNCALNEGELDCGEVILTPTQIGWLNNKVDFVDNWLIEQGA